MKECDLVMKGGITSGVVYPKCLVELAREYKFRQVGGASAGAIAAAFAAAAEMNRDGDGFERLAAIPTELAEGLGDLFQPHPQYKRLYAAIIKRMESGKAPGIWFGIRHARKIKRAIAQLPVTHFGVCPGVTVEGNKSLGLTDWLNRQLEYVAGRMPSVDAELPEEPLTFGMLEDKGVRLRLISTNLSKKRPESLPLGKGFDIAEAYIDDILPDNVAKRVRTQSQSTQANHHDVPHGQDMPVILAVRMSLAFPMLFTAVPLYSIDRSLRNLSPECECDMETPKLNLFSDGGLSSNFPIHYFDSILPTRPTFGINLSEHHPCRHGEDSEEGGGWSRIYLPAQASRGQSYGMNPIRGVGGFAMSLINSAKDWQDSLQMRMAGYRERIVHIALKGDEGGGNLNMSPELINRLVKLGGLASQRILEGHALDPNQPPFQLQVHRWRRILSASEALTPMLEGFAKSYTDPDPSGDPTIGSMQSFLEELIADHPANDEVWKTLGYKPKEAIELVKLKKRLDELHGLAQTWKTHERAQEWNMPSPEPSLVIRSKEV